MKLCAKNISFLERRSNHLTMRAGGGDLSFGTRQRLHIIAMHKIYDRGFFYSRKERAFVPRGLTTTHYSYYG